MLRIRSQFLREYADAHPAGGASRRVDDLRHDLRVERGSAGQGRGGARLPRPGTLASGSMANSRDAVHRVDLTLRPGRHYIAKETTRVHSRGIVRGRYTLAEPGGSSLSPFVGQEPIRAQQRRVRQSRADAGRSTTTTASCNSSTWRHLAIRNDCPEAGSKAGRACCDEKVSRTKRSAHVRVVPRDVGGRDPPVGSEFTFRPDGRYIAKSGAGARAEPSGARTLPRVGAR